MSNLFVDVWFTCLRMIFRLLHLMYTSFQYFDLTWTLFKRKWDSSILMDTENSELYVSRFVTRLNSCPSHIAVIVANDAISCEDFTNLVVWCLAAGISFLTIYDQKGFVKEQETKLYKYLIANSNINEHQVKLRNFPQKNGVGGNGFANKLNVNILSEEDGKQYFFNVIHSLSKSVSGDTFNLEPEIISEELERQCGFPDPELAIVIAPEMCTYGFPAWNIRLTEFVRRPNLDLSAKDFCAVLSRYNKCEKRVGK